MSKAYDAIRDVYNAAPNLSNQEIADKVNQLYGLKTTAASVATTKTRIRKNGDLTPEGAETPEMPTGTAATVAAALNSLNTMHDRYQPEDPLESSEEANARILKRFAAFERFGLKAVERKITSLIISGPPGLGKSHTMHTLLENVAPEKYEFISGTISAVGLYQTLWNRRNGGLIVLDDCDDIYKDETCLNLLKAVLDTQKVRRVAWRKQASWLEQMGIDDNFEFTGTVVFLTNIDYELLMNSDKPLAKHFEALFDRAMYLTLTLRSRRDFLLRIRQVCEGEKGMLQADMGLDQKAEQTVLDFIEERKTEFYLLSLRLVRQVAQCMAADPDHWQEDIELVKMPSPK